MPTEAEPIATLTSGVFKAEIFSGELPGEFTIRFLDGAGSVLEETKMSGVSTYRQRESEILERLQTFALGEEPAEPADLSASGEY